MYNSSVRLYIWQAYTKFLFPKSFQGEHSLQSLTPLWAICRLDLSAVKDTPLVVPFLCWGTTVNDVSFPIAWCLELLTALTIIRAEDVGHNWSKTPDLIYASDIAEVDGLPPVHIGPQRKIHVFNSCSAFPATNGHNCLSSPNSRCSIEVEETTMCKVYKLLTLAVKIEGDLLGLQNEHCLRLHHNSSDKREASQVGHWEALIGHWSRHECYIPFTLMHGCSCSSLKVGSVCFKNLLIDTQCGFGRFCERSISSSLFRPTESIYRMPARQIQHTMLMSRGTIIT